MKMKHFTPYLCLAGLLSTLFLAACGGTKGDGQSLLPDSDDPAVQAGQYRDSLALWNASGPKSYLLKLNWGAHAPIRGDWEITIMDGVVVNRLHDGKQVQAESRAMSRMTMDRLFEMAAPVTNTRHEGPFVIKARFRADGTVASISRLKNTNAQAEGPRDKTFAVTIEPVSRLN